MHTVPQRATDERGVPIARRLPVVRPPRYDRAAVFTLSKSGEVAVRATKLRACVRTCVSCRVVSCRACVRACDHNSY